MATFFFDSSALIKRYVHERGSKWVIGILAPATGHRIQVARITGVEVVAAISRRARGGSLSAAGAATIRSRFRRDFASQYRHVALTPTLLTDAMDLAATHALRGYDAVQLAAALKVNSRRRKQRRSPLTLVSADAELNAAAVAEGLAVEDPNAHP